MTPEETKAEYLRVREALTELGVYRNKLTLQLKEQYTEGVAAKGVQVVTRKTLECSDVPGFLKWLESQGLAGEWLFDCLKIDARLAAASLDEAEITAAQTEQAKQFFSLKTTESIDVR